MSWFDATSLGHFRCVQSTGSRIQTTLVFCKYWNPVSENDKAWKWHSSVQELQCIFAVCEIITIICWRWRDSGWQVFAVRLCWTFSDWLLLLYIYSVQSVQVLGVSIKKCFQLIIKSRFFFTFWSFLLVSSSHGEKPVFHLSAWHLCFKSKFTAACCTKQV